ncbi:MAG TPA: enoyl-CoA hydratase-related protein, partial [Steroidobacteraceae bacterium]|nr:enoyl-CoA hydratase-related protein [Steroidobacteraceae bacterium]
MRPAGATGKLRRMSEQILASQGDGICELRFNRPEKRNAITFAMYEALARHLHAALADPAVRVVLLCGAGASFTAG